MTARDELAVALLRAADGDRAALKFFYERTSAKLFGVVHRILADRGDAEDVLQDVYVTIWRKAVEFDPSRASPITWAATIARNRAIDRFRARGKRDLRPLDDAAEVADDAPSAFDAASASEEGRRLAEALAEIEPRAAAAIRAAFFEGATYADLAERAGVPEGTMKSWIRRGLMSLRTKLEA